MAGKTYVTKGYSTYTDIPARQGGYDHGRKEPVNQYVETKTIERVGAPTAGGTNFVGSPSKVELLKEFVHAPSKSTSPKYAPKDHYGGYEPNYGQHYENSSPPRYYEGEDVGGFFNKVQTEASRPTKHSNFSRPNKYRPSSPVHAYPLEEGHLIGTGSLSGTNKYHPSNPGSEGARYVRTGNFSGPNNSWQSAGPPVTRHPLTTSTNNLNEALGLLEESANYAPRSNARRGGVLDDLSTRPQPIEPERRYAKPAFVGKTNNARYNTIDSQEASRKYRAHLVP